MCPYSLDRKEHLLFHYGVFKVRADTRPLELRPVGRSLKTQQRVFTPNTEVDVLLGELGHRTNEPKLEHRRAERLPE